MHTHLCLSHVGATCLWIYWQLVYVNTILWSLWSLRDKYFATLWRVIQIGSVQFAFISWGYFDGIKQNTRFTAFFLEIWNVLYRPYCALITKWNCNRVCGCMHTNTCIISIILYLIMTTSIGRRLTMRSWSLLYIVLVSLFNYQYQQ